MSSDPTAASCYGHDADLGLMLRCITQLAPLFQTGATTQALAARMAASAIESYRPESPADYVNAARAIAFSIAAIGLVTQAATPALALPEQLRIYGRANALNRSADRSELTMMQRRQYRQANPPQNQSSAGPVLSEACRQSEPAYQPDEAEIQAAVQEAVAAHRVATEAAANAQPTAPSPGVPPVDLSRTPVPASATAEPSGAAIPYSGPRMKATVTPRRSSPMKSELLRFSAIQRVAEHGQPCPP